MKPYQKDQRCFKASLQINQGTRKVRLLALKIILDRSPFLIHGSFGHSFYQLEELTLSWQQQEQEQGKERNHKQEHERGRRSKITRSSLCLSLNSTSVLLLLTPAHAPAPALSSRQKKDGVGAGIILVVKFPDLLYSNFF